MLRGLGRIDRRQGRPLDDKPLDFLSKSLQLCSIGLHQALDMPHQTYSTDIEWGRPANTLHLTYVNQT